MLAASLALLALSAAPADPAAALAAARRGVEAKKPEEVLFALDGLGALPEKEAEEAAGHLAKAAELSLAQKDGILALQLCQMALRRKASHPDALSACATAAQSQSQFDPAERYVAELREKHPSDPRGPLLAARLAAAQGEWEKVRVAAKAVPKGAGKAEAQKLLAKAEKELAELANALTQDAELTRRLEEATVKAKAMGGTTIGGLPGMVATGGVVVYRTEWCGVCKRAEAWLAEQKVPFTSRDLEAEPGATLELAAKAAAKGINPSGVPVIDVNGDLMVGFSEPVLAKKLKKAGLLR